jgi:hypothetical protein
MVPGLEERLLSGSEEEILHVADLVRHPSSITLTTTVHCQHRSKKVPRTHGLMIQRA